MRNDDIVTQWINNLKCIKKHKALSTDGQNLFSYGLLIGYTNPQGHKVAIDRTRIGGDYRSMTTSTHVGIAKRLCSLIRSPYLSDSTSPIEIPKAVYDAKAITKKSK